MDERPTYPKSGCCVPFCRRTSRRFKEEWICGDHWKLVPRDLKTFRTKRLKQIRLAFDKAEALRRACARGEERQEHYRRTCRLARRWDRTEKAIWRRMKRIAIEKATGI